MQPPGIIGFQSFSVGIQVKQPVRIPQAAQRMITIDTTLTAISMGFTGNNRL
jgi:hypothetical protein